MYGSGNESKENKNKEKRVQQYINNEKIQIIYEYEMLEYFYLLLGGGFTLEKEKQRKHKPDTIKYHLYAWGCSKGSLWNFCQGSMVR